MFVRLIQYNFLDSVYFYSFTLHIDRKWREYDSSWEHGVDRKLWEYDSSWEHEDLPRRISRSIGGPLCKLNILIYIIYLIF